VGVTSLSSDRLFPDKIIWRLASNNFVWEKAIAGEWGDVGRDVGVSFLPAAPNKVRRSISGSQVF
jgi:hypothetical protein